MTGVTPAELGGHAFLHGMSDGHLAVLARACWVTPVREGHRFFGEGDPRTGSGSSEAAMSHWTCIRPAAAG